MTETPAERRARERAETAGLTEEQLLAREDAAYAKAKFQLQAFALADAYRAQSKSVPSFTAATATRSAKADHRAALARDLIAKGKSKREVAKMAGVTVRTVGRWLERPVP